MAVKETQKKYNAKNIKRVPLDMQKTDYEKLSAYCKHEGESVNGFIKSLIAPYLEKGAEYLGKDRREEKPD